MTKFEILKRYGDIASIARAEEFEYSSGKARGTRGINVKCGDLSFVILTDRGMDISYCEYKGIPVSFISKTGVVSPNYYDETDFLRSFTGGLLTTCGLSYMGANCQDEGEELGIHGRISNMPAYDICVKKEWINDEYYMTICGKVQESKVFCENLVLSREIKIKLGETKISINDVVENLGYADSPFMLLYHINFGYPLVDEGAILETNCEYPIPRDEEAKKGLEMYNVFEKPQNDYKEQVFYHKPPKDAYAKIVNKLSNLCATVRFDGEELPYLVEWKQMGEGDYTVGIEPATNTPEGRKKAREIGELNFIKPHTSRKFNIEIEIE